MSHSTPSSKEIQELKKRLAWRCRRGMLELDLILQPLVEEDFGDATLDDLRSLDNLLSRSDNDLWDLLVAGGEELSLEDIRGIGILQSRDRGIYNEH